MVEDAIIATIKNYLASLPAFGIHACRAVLFGSYVRGKANEYSDIDFILIAPEFDGSREISLIKALWRANVTDSRIELIPCGEHEWETDGSRPILEIARREGVIITV